MARSRGLAARARKLLARDTGRGRAETGLVTLEYVILMPALFALLFLGVQIGLFYQARSVAMAAATEGARAAGTEGSSAGAGERAAWSFIAAAGGQDVLRKAGVAASRSATEATVTVRGTSMSVIPGWSPQISQRATAPVERTTG